MLLDSEMFMKIYKRYGVPGIVEYNRDRFSNEGYNFHNINIDLVYYLEKEFNNMNVLIDYLSYYNDPRSFFYCLIKDDIATDKQYVDIYKYFYKVSNDCSATIIRFFITSKRINALREVIEITDFSTWEIGLIFNIFQFEHMQDRIDIKEINKCSKICLEHLFNKYQEINLFRRLIAMFLIHNELSMYKLVTRNFSHLLTEDDVDKLLNIDVLRLNKKKYRFIVNFITKAGYDVSNFNIKIDL